nr:MAG TPA: hypothetical protein [Caudoviricetes sp.]
MYVLPANFTIPLFSILSNKNYNPEPNLASKESSFTSSPDIFLNILLKILLK